MIRRERWWCDEHDEWHDPDQCAMCLTEWQRLGYGEIRAATRVMQAMVGAEVIFRGKVCDVHPTRDDFAAAGLSLAALADLQIWQYFERKPI